MATRDISSSGARALIRNAILIAGPTASGKSRLAIDLAERLGGIVVNTDSMQVYSILDVLTARPGPDDMARVDHALYGHIHPQTVYSTGNWMREVMAMVEDGAFAGRRPVFVGGTGLYFRALEQGLSQMPEVPGDVREHWRNELAEKGPEVLHEVLSRKDARAAATLKPGDSQRIVRALEVLDASGSSILDWQAERGTPMIERESASFIVIEPDRGELVERIDRRFDAMIDAGALEEVRALAELDPDPALPATKAIGFRELSAALTGSMAMPDAIERAKIATRQYSKRQSTWFRNQLGAHWRRISRAEELNASEEINAP